MGAVYVSQRRTVIREVRKEGCGDGEERSQIIGTKMLMEKKGTREWDKRRNDYTVRLL